MMELPNNLRVGTVIADIVEALTAICKAEGLEPPGPKSVAALWHRDRAMIMLHALAMASRKPESLRDLNEIRETLISMHTAYAIHLRGKKDEERDYDIMRTMVKVRKITQAAPGVVPLKILAKRMAKEEG